jgi:tetratricopeptide (TPR) repeat protein
VDPVRVHGRAAGRAGRRELELDHERRERTRRRGRAPEHAHGPEPEGRVHRRHGQAAPWVALAELYRAWDYTEQALAVATQGAAPNILPDGNEAGQLWYLVGMAYDDKSLFEKSIEAYTKAVEQRRDLHQAKFQRGQAYYKMGNYPNAKRDLEDFSKTGGASVNFEKAQASKMLMDIAAKTATQPAPGGERMSPEDVVKKSKKAT